MSKETKYCPNCGEEIDVKADFCPECGRKMAAGNRMGSFIEELEKLSFSQVLFGVLIWPYGLYLLWKAFKRSR